jgi:hypothetical protein
MALYYVNKNEQDNGDHEVHEWRCEWLPLEENRIYLGEFATCDPAVSRAKEYYEQSNGCVHCSRACHTT